MYLRGAADVLLGLSIYVAAVDAASSFKAEVLYPQDVSLTVYQNDAIIVRYNSEIPDNSLYTWCWDNEKVPTLSSQREESNSLDIQPRCFNYQLLDELFLNHILFIIIIGGNLLAVHDYF
ncbi:unnamed protein product [Clonostachys solani]|uniref:Uncharacterized protein n=1 Tax=Clonostachys solani TaxID=160281 RepID=A0A9N9ZLL1_9HYPO|nr:unnamed protein product [Clonostachys solani]